MRSFQLALVFVLACGGKTAPPRPPPPLDAKQLAHLIYDDFALLGDLAKRLRGKCPELIAELKPHVARMQLRHGDVDRMLRDVKQATELKTELATYADQLKGMSDKIGADLATTYLSCCPARGRDVKDHPKCPDGYQLERVIADMPTY